MFTKKISSWAILLLIILGAFGGIGSLVGGNRETEQEYADVKSFAEYIAKLYMTVDSNIVQRKDQLQLIAPSMAELLTKSKDTQQWVQEVKAGKVEQYDSSRYSVSVETWTVALKKVKEEKKEGEVEKTAKDNQDAPTYIQRRYTIDLDIISNSLKGYVVSGLPKIREIPLEKIEVPKNENVLDEQLILPIIEATFPSIFAGGDISNVSNYFTDDATINPFPGGYKFQKVLSTQIFKSGKKDYRVLVFVEVLDPITDVTVGLKVTTDMVENNEKYYLKNVY
ncbi:hypothetical protein EJP82_26045 [Paenibacillus anaericanus]|uniref:Uncharacterized protein n=1 Tax=Paenibacillus anaericanus TaxID=170367 RepID=A0A3S1BH93_9BACL|nr:hypothetical protein [Paenibacillus anaericanus]RUT39495.1 hypothetical protein EJP82_26045 [Paenibacillus anaericanus]